MATIAAAKILEQRFHILPGKTLRERELYYVPNKLQANFV